jgi:membrane fusion protein, heavy metal efflux system
MKSSCTSFAHCNDKLANRLQVIKMKNRIEHMKSITLALCLFLLLFSCKKDAEQTDTTTPGADNNTVQLTGEQIKQAEIVIGQPQQKDMSTAIRLNGVIEVPPANKISVSNPFGGYIKKMNLLPGTRVKQGDILVAMEDPQYIQLQQDYLMAKSKLEFLSKDFQRQRELNADKSTSDKIFQQASSDYMGQKILTKSLYEKLKLIHINPDQLDENSVSGSVTLRSPINGYVAAIYVNVGKYVSPTDVLLLLVDESKLHVSLTAFEKDMALITIGQKVNVFSNVNSQKIYTAQVHLNDERTSEIHCELENADKELLPGMFVTGEILIKNNEVISVPEDAIVSWEDKDYVFIEKSSGVFTMYPVETGMTTNGFTELNNISATQKLVVKNAYSLLMKMKSVQE